MKISKKVTDKQWYTYEGEVGFCIRPFPFSSLKSVDTMEMALEQFMYCIVDWKGIDDGDKSTTKKAVAFKCTDENKKYLYDYSDAVRSFIFDKLGEQTKDVDIIIKN